MQTYTYKYSRESETQTLESARDWFALRSEDGRSLLSPTGSLRFRGDAYRFLQRQEVRSRVPHAGVQLFQSAWPRVDIFESAQNALSDQHNVRTVNPVLTHEGGREPVVPTGNLVVKFDCARNRNDCIQQITSLGLVVKRTIYPHAWDTNRFFVEVPENQILDVFAAALRLYEIPDVEVSYPELVMRREYRSEWPRVWPHQWNLADVISGIDGDINVQEAWQITRGEGAVIAVIDEAFDVRGHPEFADLSAANPKVVSPIRVTSHGLTFFEDDSVGGYGHGTGVAGLACANGLGAWNPRVGPNGGFEGVSGVAPGARLMPISFAGQLASASDLGLGSEMEGLAFQWAMDRGADVICCCWGPPDDNGITHQMPENLSKIVHRAATTEGRNGRGCVIVFAAGNAKDGVDRDGYAGHPDVFAVGACTAKGARSVSSEFGKALLCMAPGEPIGVNGEWRDIESTRVTGASSWLQLFSHTSAAAAQVAGAVALMLSARPDLKPPEIRQLLRVTCTKTAFDRGEGPYDADGSSIFHGFGRIDVGAAVRFASVLNT